MSKNIEEEREDSPMCEINYKSRRDKRRSEWNHEKNRAKKTRKLSTPVDQMSSSYRKRIFDRWIRKRSKVKAISTYVHMERNDRQEVEVVLAHGARGRA